MSVITVIQSAYCTYLSFNVIFGRSFFWSLVIIPIVYRKMPGDMTHLAVFQEPELSAEPHHGELCEAAAAAGEAPAWSQPRLGSIRPHLQEIPSHWQVSLSHTLFLYLVNKYTEFLDAQQLYITIRFFSSFFGPV